MVAEISPSCIRPKQFKPNHLELMPLPEIHTCKSKFISIYIELTLSLLALEKIAEDTSKYLSTLSFEQH